MRARFLSRTPLTLVTKKDKALGFEGNRHSHRVIVAIDIEEGFAVFADAQGMQHDDLALIEKTDQFLIRD